MTSKVSGVATLGGGCFWCVEAIFQALKGVERVVSGYSGGPLKNPTYREVCSGRTGHAEVIQVHFDPEVIGYDDLIRVFLSSHDPTTLNRQGADWGSQYRSIILYHDEGQRQVAKEVIEELTPAFDNPIVTEVSPFTEFYVAEADHQNFYKDNPGQPYCSVIISPKLQKLRALHADKLKAVEAE